MRLVATRLFHDDYGRLLYPWDEEDGWFYAVLAMIMWFVLIVVLPGFLLEPNFRRWGVEMIT